MNNNRINKSSYTQDEDAFASNMVKCMGSLKDKAAAEDESSDKKNSAATQKRQKIAYHNTLMLLKNYRNIAWIAECLPETIAYELDEKFKDIDTIIDRIDIQLSLENKKLESRLEGAKKTRLLLDRINEALTVLMKKPGNGPELYKVISETFIIPEIYDVRSIAQKLRISLKKYYRLREQAISIISIRLWAAPTLETDIWLNMMTMLNQF